MRDVVALALTSSLALVAGCQAGRDAGVGGPQPAAAPPGASAPSPSSTTSAAPASPAAPAAPADQADHLDPAASAEPAGPTASPAADRLAQEPAATPAHVKLPRSPATPLRRTARGLPRPKLDWLAAVTFPDFDRQERRAPQGSIEVRHVTQSRPHLGVTVTIGPCASRMACPPMTLPRWTARHDELLGQLPKELRDRPDTRFEIGARTLGTTPAIFTYQLGYSSGKDETDQPSLDYTDAYTLYYNDGINQIRVMAHYVDDPVGGIDRLLAVAPPEDLEKLAVAFASFYVHAWN